MFNTLMNILSGAGSLLQLYPDRDESRHYFENNFQYRFDSLMDEDWQILGNDAQRVLVWKTAKELHKK
jgi:hypothetical protein